jgi:exopolysaccharide biosynthesis polyprenyl glycosylphosphotransferase
VIALAAAGTTGAKAATHLFEPFRSGQPGLRQVVVLTLALAVAFHLHGLYRRPPSRLRPSGWWPPVAVARCLPTGVLLALATEAVLLNGARMTLTSAVAMAAPAAVFVPVGRRLVMRLFGPPTVTRILVLGTGDVAERLAARLHRCPDTLVVGFADDDRPPETVLGTLRDVPDLCREHRIDHIIVAFSRIPSHSMLEVLRRLEGKIPVAVIPRLFELHSWRCELEELQGLWLIHIPPAQHFREATLAKRLLDLTLASLGVALLLPAGLLLAALIKLDSRGPVFFRQERLGRGRRPFRIFKLRTMTQDAGTRRAAVLSLNESDGPLFKLQNDPRVTAVGRILRRTSLDELPQLLNVIRGEMSLVGPRPLPTEESNRLDGPALARFDMAPGLTGLWQVSGRSDLRYADLQHLDSVYVRSWSLRWDLRIIMQTPRCVMARRGAY